VNLYPGSLRRCANDRWEALAEGWRFVAVFIGISSKGSALWELQVWRGESREVHSPLRSLAACRRSAESLRMRAVK
jgi:hypothetical protein